MPALPASRTSPCVPTPVPLLPDLLPALSFFPTPPSVHLHPRPLCITQKLEVEVATTVLYNKYSGVDLPGKDIDFVVARARPARSLIARLKT